LDPSILSFRKNIDVRAGTEHVRSQCVKEGTYPLAFRGQLLWSGTGGSEVQGVTRSARHRRLCLLADLAVGKDRARSFLTDLERPDADDRTALLSRDIWGRVKDRNWTPLYPSHSET
jgi:hypothetical protein